MMMRDLRFAVVTKTVDCLCLFLVCATVSLISSDLPAAERPNVVMVFIDDMGWDDFSCFGNTDVRTPQIDRLAAEGVPEKLLESVHSPIGLEIGGRTPAEIAVSILAQVVQYRNRQAPRERRVHVLKSVVEV